LFFFFPEKDEVDLPKPAYLIWETILEISPSFSGKKKNKVPLYIVAKNISGNFFSSNHDPEISGRMAGKKNTVP